MIRLTPLLFFSAVLALSAQDSLTPVTSAEQLPQSASALWKGYDATAEPLEIKVHHEWKKDGVVSRLITFKVGTFKGTPARLAAYYSFPANGKKNPAFVWSHGGGQRADRRRGHYFATQGFATIDINWLGRPLEEVLDPDNNWGTDWGKIDPTQGPRFYPKALRKGWKASFHPDEFSIDPIISPRNSNWFMLSLAGRRALTFLERQPEVDPAKLGFTGFSMGGTITSMTATDKRLKAVAPFVGGTGFLHQNHPGMTSGSVIRNIGDLDLYIKTIDPSAYWKEVKIPVMFITSSNDFHSAFHRISRSMDLLPHKNWRVTGNMHANHNPGPEQWILLNHWFKQHLAGEEKNIPLTPPSTFKIVNSVAHFAVTPAQSDRLQEVEIYYSHDPNCLTRFWKKTSARVAGNTWKTELKVHPRLPLYTFALCRYQLAEPEALERGTASSFTLNSELHAHLPEEVDLAAFVDLPKSGLIDDFADGLTNWSSRDQHSIKTYKFQDPELDTSPDRKLALTFNLEKDRPLLLGLGAESKFLGGGRDLGNFHHGRRIAGEGKTTFFVSLADFKNKEDKALEWSKIATFSLTLTDQKTKQRIKLTRPTSGKVLRRIELVRSTEAKMESQAAQRRKIRLYMAGYKIFARSCVPCHGRKGKGDGAWAEGWATHRPRNFQSGIFKFRSTPMGKLPTDADLKRTITNGISGTAMPSFEKQLRESEYDAVIHYLKKFSTRWDDPKNVAKPLKLPTKPPVWLQEKESIAVGKTLFQNNCVACHGPKGQGDGIGSKGLKDIWNFAIQPADLTKGTFKSGTFPADLYRTLATGLDGTPMVGFRDLLTEKQLWQLVGYIIYSLNEKGTSND